MEGEISTVIGKDGMMKSEQAFVFPNPWNQQEEEEE